MRPVQQCLRGPDTAANRRNERSGTTTFTPYCVDCGVCGRSSQPSCGLCVSTTCGESSQVATPYFASRRTDSRTAANRRDGECGSGSRQPAPSVAGALPRPDRVAYGQVGQATIELKMKTTTTATWPEWLVTPAVAVTTVRQPLTGHRLLCSPPRRPDGRSVGRTPRSPIPPCF